MKPVDPQELQLVDASLLPPQIRRFVQLIGLPETLKLLEARGGLPTYIPAQPSDSCELAGVISRTALAKLAEAYGSSTLDIPKADKIRAQLRDHYILEASRRGVKSGRQLARETGVTYRWVKIVRARGREPDPTGDLFAALDTDAPAPDSK